MANKYKPVRRRFLAGLGALGLTPAVRAQTEPNPSYVQYRCENIVQAQDKKSSLSVVVQGTKSNPDKRGYQFELAGSLLPDSVKSDDVKLLTDDKTNVILRVIMHKQYGMTEFGCYEFSVLLRGINFLEDGAPAKRDLIIALIFPKNEQYHFSRTVYPNNGDKPNIYKVSSRTASHIIKSVSQPYTVLTESHILYQNLKGHKVVQVGVFDKLTQKPLIVTGAIKPNFSAIEQTAEKMLEAETEKLKAGQCKMQATSGCYLTTATVEAIGLRDDCWELEALRAFRDGAVQNMLGGDALIAKYYGEAPYIVTRINARHDAPLIWCKFYVLHIFPAALSARLGLYGLALKIYKRAIRYLERLASEDFLPVVKVSSLN